MCNRLVSSSLCWVLVVIIGLEIRLIIFFHISWDVLKAKKIFTKTKNVLYLRITMGGVFERMLFPQPLTNR